MRLWFSLLLAIVCLQRADACAIPAPIEIPLPPSEWSSMLMIRNIGKLPTNSQFWISCEQCTETFLPENYSTLTGPDGAKIPTQSKLYRSDTENVGWMIRVIPEQPLTPNSVYKLGTASFSVGDFVVPSKAPKIRIEMNNPEDQSEKVINVFLDSKKNTFSPGAPLDKDALLKLREARSRPQEEREISDSFLLIWTGRSAKGEPSRVFRVSSTNFALLPEHFRGDDSITIRVSDVAGHLSNAISLQSPGWYSPEPKTPYRLEHPESHCSKYDRQPFGLPSGVDPVRHPNLEWRASFFWLCFGLQLFALLFLPLRWWQFFLPLSLLAALWGFTELSISGEPLVAFLKQTPTGKFPNSLPVLHATGLIYLVLLALKAPSKDLLARVIESVSSWFCFLGLVSFWFDPESTTESSIKMLYLSLYSSVIIVLMLIVRLHRALFLARAMAGDADGFRVELKQIEPGSKLRPYAYAFKQKAAGVLLEGDTPVASVSATPMRDWLVSSLSSASLLSVFVYSVMSIPSLW